jgi:tetrahydromethanopterin S-methyltransferase subunit D
MSFFLAPITFVFELIGFLISAAFVYGLALIVGGVILWYGISTLPKSETIVEYVTVVEKHEVTKFVEKGPELICTRLSGCKTFPNAKTEEEYCPSCVMK